MTLSTLLGRRTVALVAALLLCALVVGAAWACGGSSETQDPTATTAPDADPDPTIQPAATPTTLSVITGDPAGRNWNVLGSMDALVTVLDYSDFQ